MNSAQLRAFHAVALAGSYTRASEARHVTQPTLSGQVKALEESYGVRLFERRARGVELTELGRSLLDITRRFYALEADAEQLLSAARSLTSGQLRVGADAPYHVVPLLAAFNRRHPGIRLSFSFGNSEQVLKDLLERRSEVAVLAELAPDRRVHAVPFRKDRLVAFVDRGHAWARRRSLRLEELADQRLVLREPGSITRAIFERALAAQGIVLGPVLEIGSREAVGEAVAAGLGIGVVFESEFGRDPRLHALALRGGALEAVEYAACLEDRRPVRVVRAFFELLRELNPAT
ncbi:MAG: LysR substrate-binding domain-containing protein [Rhodospirillales bacterium]|nr:LysR substrate-binding domain-containing protein [Rhodospirillales bacterium]